MPRPAHLSSAAFRQNLLSFDAAEDKIAATFNGEDIWSLVHRGGVGLLADTVGKGIAHDLSKTLLRLAVAGQQAGRAGGPTLTAR